MYMHKHPSQVTPDTSGQMAHRDVAGVFAGSQDDTELGNPGVVEGGGCKARGHGSCRLIDVVCGSLHPLIVWNHSRFIGIGIDLT